MCGITGVFDVDRKFGVNEKLISEMANTLIHRGPDDDGVYIDDNVGLGFRRLSIMDIEHGAQPMFNEDKSMAMVCNGEIYNYKELKNELALKGHFFKTNCDVEVIIHLYEEYGPSFLKKLNGQFAFCIYDQRNKSLFIARDHIGIAPLFYTFQNGVFVFGSEIKSILKHPTVKKEVNLKGLDQIFSFPGNVSPTTMFKGINALKPGHYISFSEQELKVKEYWDLTYPIEDGTIYPDSEASYLEELEATLKQAISYRLNSDVPVGYYLSGGLDSSLMAAMITELNGKERKKSFSISFNDSGIDESYYQNLMLPITNSQRINIPFDWQDIDQKLRAAVYYAEAPLKETYNTCSLALSQKVKECDIKVILTGEGADELFAGYVGYKFDHQKRGEVHHFAETDEAFEQEIRQELWGKHDFVYEKNYYEFRETKRAIYSENINNCFDEFDSVKSGIVDKSKIIGRNPLHIRSYLDFKLRLSDHLVADHGDRVAYANSIEARYPFLDINLIELVKRIPPQLKLKGMTEKYLLKKCAENYIPKAIIDREKFSFVAPGSQYLINRNLEWINDLLSYETIKRQGYFNPDTVERLKKMYKADGFKLNQTFETDFLMIILTFGIFIEEFNLS